MHDDLASPQVVASVRSAENQPAKARTDAGPLKICFISEPLHAGVGRHVVEATCELASRGHEIHVLYSPMRLDEQFLAALNRQPTIRCHAIPMPRGIGGGDLAAFRAINAYVTANGPFDIIHGHSSKGGGYARLLKLFGTARTVIYTPQAFITLSRAISKLNRLIYRRIETFLARQTDTIICCSQAEIEHAAGYLGISRDRLTVIANGSSGAPNKSRQAAREAMGLAPQQIAVGFIGRMEDQKAPQELIEAVLPLLPQVPDLHVVMIGDGHKRRALEDRVREAGLENRISWLGAVDGRDYTAGMDIFALSSLYEGFAYVLIEALNAGLPIVSTPVGGAHESILPGVNGFMVPHGAPREMAEALRKIACDADLRQRMAAASAERAALFTIPAMVNAMEALYYQKDLVSR